MLVIVLLFFRETPKGYTNTEPISTAKKHKTRGEGWSGIEFSKAIKKPYFYIAVFCIFGTGMTLQGLAGIGTPHMYDIGFEKSFVAWISSFSCITLTVAKVSSGFMYDRYGIRKTMNFCFMCAAFSLVGLIVLRNTPAGHVIAFLRSIISSFALPLETIMLPLFAMEFFGNKDFTRFIGIFSAANYAGFAIGSPLGNLCYDIFGDYIVSFYIFSVFLTLVIFLMQYALLASRRDRKEIESANV